MQGTFETEKIVRTRPSNEKVLERKKFGRNKSLRTRERENLSRSKRSFDIWEEQY